MDSVQPMDSAQSAEAGEKAEGGRSPALRTVLLVAGLLVVVAPIAVGAGLAYLLSARGESSGVSFEEHRAEFDGAVRYIHESGVTDAYAEHLPAELAHLAADGFVSVWRDTVFFPQWMGTPDDAGGYWYSPATSPEGFDMYGMICRDPVQLDVHWWSCALASS